MEYEVPHALEAAISIFIHPIRFKKHLLSNNPLTYTLCQEKSNAYPSPGRFDRRVVSGLLVGVGCYFYAGLAVEAGCLFFSPRSERHGGAMEILLS
ncbi:hypothetical protein DB41_HL00020 [Neochlamydia sp. TUME1]|uniref:hypothetical protein n=1 Tax=Neochlamydia sp. TUME1 TaxID=1478174 RepID=UPI00057F58B5|nr:hypothetical protein [Neochlamydia sp. TUME1]KIC75469.1 hypothetical protein DB41_HL00020 [Neochlamydia sp. TUME1]